MTKTYDKVIKNILLQKIYGLGIRGPMYTDGSNLIYITGSCPNRRPEDQNIDTIKITELLACLDERYI